MATAVEQLASLKSLVLPGEVHPTREKPPHEVSPGTPRTGAMQPVCPAVKLNDVIWNSGWIFVPCAHPPPRYAPAV
ncbi:hypothetical protein CPB84DRAFT_1774688 [Gymnopilus junonius]|uniref:Uncharacterized protein n=1 Tax=Gymnopilus junonius TaxID=109634 RepID=A0A9P5NTK5_GYMJU|nr:hypothetical protein CPB84DRAFT_1774688 [Gymnopilus junonius]